jgi:hypothetical protein
VLKNRWLPVVDFGNATKMILYAGQSQIRKNAKKIPVWYLLLARGRE